MSEKPRGSDRSKGAPCENGSETVEGSTGLLRRGRERGAGVTLVSSSVVGGGFLWKALFAIIRISLCLLPLSNRGPEARNA